MTFDLKKISGLSNTEATKRLHQYGFNELPQMQGSSLFLFILKLFREPMFLLLLIGAALYFLLGDKAQALMLLSFVLVIMGITCYQEYRSEKALVALRNLSSPRALVIRDGRGVRISSRELVPGDVIGLSEGDVVAADAQIFYATNLLADEAILTGESQPVRKVGVEETSFVDLKHPGGNDLPFVYAGTKIVRGSGYAQVLTTGSITEIGKIGTSLSGFAVERTPLQHETDRLVKNFSIFGFGVCLLVAIVYGATRTEWLQGFLVGIALAMAILPAELPVVITVFLALGARRIAASHVLTRNIPAIEALGSATVLCVDKTGTLTENQMSVSSLFANNSILEFVSKDLPRDLPENFHQLMEYSVLASERDPFDPMEIAIKNFGSSYLKGTDHWHESWRLIHQYPLSQKMLAISQVWQSKKNKHYVVAAKGAPEDIFDLCHLSNNKINELQQQINFMAQKGLRVIGVAKAVFGEEKLPSMQHDFDFEFLGLIGLEDPVRESVAESIRECHAAGIRVIMITGDYLGTAQKVASQIGFADCCGAMVGSDLAEMSDVELEQKIKGVNIFARILPEQKLRIVKALQASGEVVAMTGDGVNDAPALKAANIGVAMGGRGSDVARESAGLVLLNDSFISLVAAIRLGRRIYTNIRKSICYLVAVHLPIVGLTLIPVLFKWPLLLFPIHIVFLELIIDPTCSLVFEGASEEPDIMERPPRSGRERIFDKISIRRGLVQGFGVLLFGLGVLLITRFLGWHENSMRATIFAILVISNIGLIFVNLSSHFLWARREILSNHVLWLVVVTTLSALTAVLTVPFLQRLFGF